MAIHVPSSWVIVNINTYRYCSISLPPTLFYNDGVYFTEICWKNWSGTFVKLWTENKKIWGDGEDEMLSDYS